jgi:hypothetical protein
MKKIIFKIKDQRLKRFFKKGIIVKSEIKENFQNKTKEKIKQVKTFEKVGKKEIEKEENNKSKTTKIEDINLLLKMFLDSKTDVDLKFEKTKLFIFNQNIKKSILFITNRYYNI